MKKAVLFVIAGIVLASSVAWAGPVDWIDEKVTQFIKDKSGIKGVEAELNKTKQDLVRAREEMELMRQKVRVAEEEKQRAEIQRAGMAALMWKIPAGVLMLTILLVLTRLGFRKVLQNRM